MKYKIRKADNTDSDINRIAECAVHVWHDTFDDLLEDGQVDYMIEKFQSADVLKKCLDQDGYIYYIAEYDYTVLGYCGVKPEKDKLFISKIYISPEYQHSGIASSFFRLLIEKYGEKYPIFYLTVNKQNLKAITVYKKWGFEVTDKTVTDIGSGYVMDDYIMEYKN